MRRRCGYEPHLNAVCVRIKEAGAGKAQQITGRFSEAGTGKALQITVRFSEAGLGKVLQTIARFNKDIACRAPQTDCLVDTAADLC